MEKTREMAEGVLDLCRRAGLKLATAESCTGGMIAAALTDIAGSSDVFDRGFVTYSNEAKTDMLGVPKDLLDAHGAVSAEVAEAMVSGALSNSRADLAVAVTGIAGPGGGSAGKPVGLVYMAVQRKGERPRVEEKRYGNRGRDAVRRATMEDALEALKAAASA